MSTEVAAGGPALAVDDLHVRYGRRDLLSGISFEVRPGRVFALLGRNGSGKTSLVRCLLGQQKPERGGVRLFGGQAWAERGRLMERVGVVPEEPDAPPSLSARELSAFCRRLYARWDEASLKARLDRFGVPWDLPFARLSRGQRGAVMLALGLGHSPDLLVLDDPTLGLDAVARRVLFEEVVGELADRGATVFVTSHDLAGMEGLADEVGVLHGGRLVVNEPLEALKSRFRRLRAPADTEPHWGSFQVVSSRRLSFCQEAVVSDFDDDRFRELQSARADGSLEASGLTLEEVFVAICGEPAAAEPARGAA